MKNNFATEYLNHEILVAKYKIARKSGDENAFQKARESHEALLESIKAKGEEYFRTYEMYESSRDRGNKYININESWEYQDEEKIIQRFREFGIEKFTFSSTWSGAVKSAWKFIQNGCKLEGMVEINAKTKNYMTGEYDKEPAYLFSVN